VQVCALKEIVAVTKKYRAYVYLDEAHSIGAMGATGRGVCEHLAVPFQDIDLLMGTFTKSFGSCGGYVAGSREAINHLRAHSPANVQVRLLSSISLIRK
jgi:serine palmitoyltransferase